MKAIIFDFDGVLVESVHIKTDAFRELFKDYPDQLDEFIAYHTFHGGVSRYVKIRYFFDHFFGKTISDEELHDWCAKYSQLVKTKVIAAQAVKGAKELLDQCKGRYQMFVISGTPQEEMRAIVKERGWELYFDGVYGSPTKKGEWTERILKENQFGANDAIFIGDAITDLKGAKANDLAFIGRVPEREEAPDWLDDASVLAVVKDMTDVQAILEKDNSLCP